MTYEGPERRGLNSDLQRLVAEAGAKMANLGDAHEELRRLNQNVSRLASVIQESMPRDEMAKMVDAVVREERRGRIRLLAIVTIPVLAVVALGWSNRNLLNELEDCTTPGGQCYERQRSDPRTAALIQDLTREITAEVTGDIACILNILPVDRTDENVAACLEVERDGGGDGGDGADGGDGEE